MVRRELALLIALSLGACAAPPPEDPNNPIGLNKKVLLVLIRHQQPPCPTDPNCSWLTPPNEEPTAPRHDATTWAKILNDAVNKYYKAATFDQTTFSIVPAINPATPDGWWEATYNFEDYQGAGSLWVGSKSVAQDAMSLAATAYDVTQYPRIVLLGNVKHRGAQYSLFDFESKSYHGVAMTEMPTDQAAAAILSHELAHSLGLPDLYGLPTDCGASGPCGADNFGGWDILASDPDFNHFSAWAKVNRKWLKEESIKTLPIGAQDPPFTEAVLLSPVSQLGGSSSIPNVLRLPITPGPPFFGLYVECRRKGNGDDNLAAEGILPSLVDETKTSPPCNRAARVLRSPSYSGDVCKAALRAGPGGGPGEIYADASRGIVIRNKGYLGAKCLVEVQYAPGKQPDVAISRGVETHQYTQYSLFESPDIWVDSQKNGWGKYPATATLDADGVPSGAGDVPWEAHLNRIGFRIRNLGSAPASNVKIDVSVMQPLTVPVRCGTKAGPENLVASVTVPYLDPGETHIGSVDWTPGTAATAKITVELEGVPGELSYANNRAEQTIASPLTVPISAGQSTPVSTNVTLLNGCKNLVLIRAAVLDFPPPVPDPTGVWTAVIQPREILLEPGQEEELTLSVAAPRRARAGSTASFPIVVFASEETGLLSDRESTSELVASFKLSGAVLSPSAVACKIDKATIDMGESVNVLARLNPAVPGQSLALEYVSPSGEVSLHATSEDSRGLHRHRLIPDLEGRWQVRAFWQGDREHEAAESEVCPFSVR